MPSRLVVPLDGSALAETVLPLAVSLAAALGLQVQLFRMVRQGERLGAAGVPIDGTAVPGKRSAEAILEHVSRGDTKILALSSHGRHGLGRWRHGSVAYRAAHHAPVPVLVVRSRAGPAGPPVAPRDTFQLQPAGEILVPLDGSELAAEVLPLAGHLAQKWTAPLTLLRAVPLTAPSATALVLDAVSRLHTQLLAEARAYLEHEAILLRRLSLDVTVRVAEGEPAPAIQRCVQEQQPDLIAMTTHGRTGLQEWLL